MTGELCQFEGNSDLYGLGVRLGVYAQLLATALANHVLPDALVSALDTNVIFLVAILAALLKSTAEKEISTVEAFIMLQIVLTFLISVINIDGLRWIWIAVMSTIFSEKDRLINAHFNLSRFGSFWRCSIRTLATGYNMWFWFYGYSRLGHAQDCNFKIFFFTRLNGSGSVKYLFKTLSVVYALHDLNTWAFLLIPAAARQDQKDAVAAAENHSNDLASQVKEGQQLVHCEAKSRHEKEASRWLGLTNWFLKGLKPAREIASSKEIQGLE
jgi:hypothetical protein